MPKHTYTATYAGQVFTRTTHRTYTHLVIARRSIDEAIARVHGEANSKTFAKDYAYYCREANDATREFKHTEQQIARYQSIAAKVFAEYRNEWIAEHLAIVEKQRQKGWFDTFNVVGWCGRPDLAEKSAASAKKQPWNAEVKIIPVTAK